MDFWLRKRFDVRGFGYYLIFQIMGGGRRANKYVYVKYKNPSEFKDYKTLDEHSYIRQSSGLYKEFIKAKDDKSLMYFNSMTACIYSILTDLYLAHPDEKSMRKIFKHISLKLEMCD